MAHKITENCIACGTCIDECPVEAISPGDIYVIKTNALIAGLALQFVRQALLKANSIRSTEDLERDWPMVYWPVFF